jgi:hypothetical protein
VRFYTLQLHLLAAAITLQKIFQNSSLTRLMNIRLCMLQGIAGSLLAKSLGKPLVIFDILGHLAKKKPDHAVRFRSDE